MFLTKECDYAIRVVRDLADLDVKPVKMICLNEHIHTPFAYKILKKLEKAGIVSAHRGAKGGYRLAKTPDSVTLFDVVHAIDEYLFINACLEEGHKCPRNNDDDACKVHQELIKLQSFLIDALMDTRVSTVV